VNLARGEPLLCLVAALVLLKPRGAGPISGETLPGEPDYTRAGATATPARAIAQARARRRTPPLGGRGTGAAAVRETGAQWQSIRTC